MNLHQEAETARVLLAAIPVLSGTELRTLAFLLVQAGGPGQPLRMTDYEIARELGCHPGQLRRVFLRLKTVRNPATAAPWITVQGGTRGRAIVVGRLEQAARPEPTPRVEPAGPLGISPRAMGGGS